MLIVSVQSSVAQHAKRLQVRASKVKVTVAEAMREAKEPVRDVLKAGVRSAFKVRDARTERTWAIAVRTGPRMVIENRMKGFLLHVTGGTIHPRLGQSLLIPINTYLGARIGTAKFYKLIDWLMQEKLTIVKDGILYVKPPMNTSRRGGVGVGTRVQKGFRRRFQGTNKRPSGFGLTLNEFGLTPIAVIRRSITLRARIDMNNIVRGRLVPIVLNHIAAHMARLS